MQENQWFIFLSTAAATNLLSNTKPGIYLCKINMRFHRYYNTNTLKKMKNKVFASILVLTMIILVSSCATSRKYGCPSVNVKSAKTSIS